MRPLTLDATAFRSYEQLHLTLNPGTLAIVGDNGAGKSSILVALELALYGPESRQWEPYLLDDGYADTLRITLEFEHGGDHYRIDRTFTNRTARGTAKLDLLRWHIGEAYDPGRGDRDPDYHEAAAWLPLTRETAAKTQELIEDILGFDRDILRASALLMQGDGAAFTEAGAAQRKEILTSILQLGAWDAYQAAAKRERAAADRDLAALTGQVETLDLEIAERAGIVLLRDQAADRETQGQTTVTELEKRLARLEEDAAAAREALARRDAARQLRDDRQRTLDTLTARHSEAVTKLRQLDDRLARRHEVADRAARIPDLEARHTAAAEALAAWTQLRAERGRFESDLARIREERARGEEQIHLLAEQITEAEARVAMVDSDDAVCGTCGQTLAHTEARDRARTAATADAEQAHARHAAAHDAWLKLEQPLQEAEAHCATPLPPAPDPIGNLEADLRAARAAAIDLATLDATQHEANELRQRTDTLTNEIAAAHAALYEADDALADLDDIQTPDPDPVKRDLANAREQLTAARIDLARCDDRLEQIAAKQQTLTLKREQLTAARRRAHIAALAEKAYGRDGIPALIVENAAVPAIETEANRILADIFPGTSVSLLTQRGNKDGTTRDVLDIVIAAPPAGRPRPYEMFSTSEKARINIALRAALARLLARRGRSEISMLVLDEPEGLDEKNAERLGQMLLGLAGEFDLVILLSHYPTLRDSFDNSLHVVGGGETGEPSRIVDAPALAELGAAA